MAVGGIRGALNRAAFRLGTAAYTKRLTKKAYNFSAAAIGTLANQFPGYKLKLTSDQLELANRIKIERAAQSVNIKGYVIFQTFLEKDGGIDLKRIVEPQNNMLKAADPAVSLPASVRPLKLDRVETGHTLLDSYIELLEDPVLIAEHKKPTQAK
jgi:hypothetical protein